MVVVTTNLKMDRDLFERIKSMSLKKQVSQNDLIADYLIRGLKDDAHIELESIRKIERKLQLGGGKNLDDITFEIPEMLQFSDEEKEITDFNELFNDDEQTNCDLNSIVGIVRSPEIVKYKRG